MMAPISRPVQVLDLLLNRENPRHVPKEDQEQIIEYLLGNEEVYNLARHMSANGINPLEVVAVFPDDDRNLVVAEGNRRVCAAQLLTDPEKAPEKDRARFKALAAKSEDVSEVNIVEFKTYEEARPWLQVLHDGEQDGVGRRRWKPEQKARATLRKSNDALAVAILDYAEKAGIVSPADRADLQVSTATRYLANPAVRASMGLASLATSDEIVITTDGRRFAKIVSQFVSDLANKRIHSRSKSKDWLAYAKELESTFHASRRPIKPVTIEKTPVSAQVATKPARTAKAKLVNPDTRIIAQSSALVDALNKLGSFKLSNLYNSLTSLALDEHPALLMTGAWVFVETLTALHGRSSGVEFVGYANGLVSRMGLSKEQAKARKLSLDHISTHGNAQKHDPTFTAMDPRSLYNDFQVLDDVFVELANGCIRKKTGKT